MGLEIERKYLVLNDAWRGLGHPQHIVQGFLSRDPDRVVRVRLCDEEAFLTVKGRSEGITRVEVEVSIPRDEARQLLPLCLPSLIDKTRHRIEWEGAIWELDEFHGENEGLLLAEIELASADDPVSLPPWVGIEVTEDFRYTNAALSQTPYCEWND